MQIVFNAQDISYTEAIGGEIVQVTFDYENAGLENEFNRTTPYLLISMNYEFPPFEPSIEWHDGNDDDGGSSVIDYKLCQSSLQLQLKNGVDFDITFSTDETTYNNIKSLFERIFV